MIDTVTVVFQDELDSLRLQAQSLNLYADEINTIFVIVNEDSDLETKIDTTWWGRWSDHVKIINRNYFGSVWCDNGWVSQQALKLLASSLSSTKWSVILDAKTFFVNKIPTIQTKPCVGWLEIYPVFEPSQQIVNQLFDINLDRQLGPGGVPFVINNELVRQMILWIEKKVNQPFAEWFQNQGRLTEFLLYAGWVQYQTGSLEQIYDLEREDMIPCNLCHSEVRLFEHKFKRMQTSTTVSIHRRAWSQLSQQQQNLYLNFLDSRGIK